LGFFYFPLGILGFLLTIFVLWFFRDPERMVPSSETGIISPADGVICKIEKTLPPKEVKSSEELLKISVFMNVFNVHVNRAPVAGNIKEIIYVPGKFINASLDKASENNERNILVLENDKNEEIIVVQIAGLIARRILSFVNLFDSLKIGERFGLIRFGSRVDVYLPSNYDPKVELGQKVIAGESIIAR
jgi:phosphatidylserine decarboxylase